MRRGARVGAALLLLTLAGAAPAARACPVCFGNDDSPLTHGARAAAFVLLGLSALVLGAVGGLALSIYRRQRAPGAGGAAPDGGAGAS